MFKNFIPYIMAIIALIIIILQIFTSEDQTRLESTLFNILQFIFSIGFAWMIGQNQAEAQFKKSQKNFAISAYRRIHEIDNGINRLLTELKVNVERKDTEGNRVIWVMASGIKATIKSSIADWSDIIGEEIETFSKIEELQEIGKSSIIENNNKRIEGKPEEDKNKETRIDQINELRKSLPNSLRIISKEEESGVKERITLLDKEKEEKGYITLDGFVVEDGEGKKIEETELYNEFTISVDDYAKRITVFVLKDSNEEIRGMLLNKFDTVGYQYFLKEFPRYLGKSNFKVKLIEIKNHAEINGRQWLKLKVI